MREVKDGGYGKDLYGCSDPLPQEDPDGGWPRIDKYVVKTSKSLVSWSGVGIGKSKSSGLPYEGVEQAFGGRLSRYQISRHARFDVLAVEWLSMICASR